MYLDQVKLASATVYILTDIYKNISLLKGKSLTIQSLYILGLIDIGLFGLQIQTHSHVCNGDVLFTTFRNMTWDF